MENQKLCECCATCEGLMVEMKREKCWNGPLTYFELFQKLLQLDETIIYANINPDPLICAACATQLEDTYKFLSVVRQTILDAALRAEVRVKQEPGVNFVDIFPTDHEFIPNALLMAGGVSETAKQQNPKINSSKDADPDYSPAEVKTEDYDDYEDYCDNEYGLLTPATTRFECQVCFKTYNTQAGLNAHRRVHDTAQINVTLETCEFCGIKLSETALIDHVTTTHAADNATEFVMLCSWDGCSRKFKLQSQLDAHMAQHSTSEFVCNVCDKSYSCKKNLREHQKLHGERNYHCSQCNRAFVEQRRLNEHMKTHRERFAEKFECSTCKKMFSTKSNLREHERLHGERNFHCTECNGKFTEQRRLNEHMKIHGERNFPCDQCEKAFTTQCRLREHIKYHSVGKQYACEHCDEVFRLQNSLQKHIRRNHDTAYAFHCKICAKSFIMQSDYNAHVECHNNQLNHTCSECSKQFNTLKNLRNHMAVHFVEKTIPCPAVGCEKKFRSQRDCRRHNESVHERLWKCEICSRCCLSESQLKKHTLSMHSDPLSEVESKKMRRMAIAALEKPLECGYPGCKARFQDEHRLAIHRSRHNSEATPQPTFHIEVDNSNSGSYITETVKQEPEPEKVLHTVFKVEPPAVQSEYAMNSTTPYGYTEVDQALDDHVANRLRALEEMRNLHSVQKTYPPYQSDNFQGVEPAMTDTTTVNPMTVVHFNPQ